MKTSRMFDAMTQIDTKLIDRCLSRKENTQNNAACCSSTHCNAFTFKKSFSIVCSVVLIVAVAFSTMLIALNSKQQGELQTDTSLKIGFDIAENESLNGTKIAVMTDKSKGNLYSLYQ